MLNTGFVLRAKIDFTSWERVHLGIYVCKIYACKHKCMYAFMYMYVDVVLFERVIIIMHCEQLCCVGNADVVFIGMRCDTKRERGCVNSRCLNLSST